MSTEQYQEHYRKLLDMATTLGIEAVQNKKTEALVVAYESQAWDYAAELMVMLDIPLSPRFKKERKYALSSYLLKAPKETKERLSKNKS